MRFWRTVSLGIVLFATALVSRADENNEEVAAHSSALDLAGAFSNDGFKIRDGHWAGALKPQDRSIVAVNLYAGNQYWFLAGSADEKAKRIGLQVFDEKGQLVTTEPYTATDKAAAGFSPASSGQYYIALTLLEGEPATLCLVYSYK